MENAPSLNPNQQALLVHQALLEAYRAADFVRVHALELSSAASDLHTRLAASAARGHLRGDFEERQQLEQALARVLTARTHIEETVGDLLTKVSEVTS